MAADESIALALSGGGVRAMAFHSGVLQAMAEAKQLELVSRLSTVSGGSLFAGLVFHLSGMRWPASEQYLAEVYPRLSVQMTSRSMKWGAIRQLRYPQNWRFALSRANLLDLALRSEWGVTAALAELPDYPEWSINATTAESGKRFRFKGRNIGDYVVGYADTKNGLSLATAMAVSAAFPVGFGPLAIDARKFIWRKRAKWSDPESERSEVAPKSRRLHLYDGGVYDNLGLEPFFDTGLALPKPNIPRRIIVSDAGAPLGEEFSTNPFSIFRVKRLLDIATDQSRALRVRVFSRYVMSAAGRGAFISIVDEQFGPSAGRDRSFAMAFPTTLNRLTEQQFSTLARHGYRAAVTWAERT